MNKFKISFAVLLVTLFNLSFASEDALEYSDEEVTIEESVVNEENSEWELQIDNIEVIDTKTLDILFNLELNENSYVDVNIINQSDDLEYIDIEDYEIVWNKLTLLLVENLNISNYSITIISLEWTNWEIIWAGVDWIIEFNVNEETKQYWEDIIEEEEEEEVELNSADTTNETEVVIEEDNNEATNEWEEIIEVVAENNDVLPETGPAQTLLFLLLAFVMWAVVSSQIKKRQA